MDLIEKVSILLNDYEEGYENIRWSKEEIADYVQEGAIQVALLKPDAFAKQMDIELQEGQMQKLPDDVMTLIDVLGVRDEYGRISSKPIRVNHGAGNIARAYFQDLICLVVSNPYRVKTYEIDSSNDRVFYVYPPVPRRQEVTMVIEGIPEKIEDIPSKYHNAVIEWALYRAFGKDLESSSDNQVSQQHLQHFYSIVDLSVKTDERIRNMAKDAT